MVENAPTDTGDQDLNIQLSLCLGVMKLFHLYSQESSISAAYESP